VGVVLGVVTTVVVPPGVVVMEPERGLGDEELSSVASGQSSTGLYGSSPAGVELSVVEAEEVRVE